MGIARQQRQIMGSTIDLNLLQFYFDLPKGHGFDLPVFEQVKALLDIRFFSAA